MIVFSFVCINYMAWWFSWLERRPVTAEVEGSSPFQVVFGRLAQLGEHLPYKQGVIGSIPIATIKSADVAQLAEQLTCNQQVIGSSPIVGLYGGIPERPKGADCKSVADSFEGSNPSSSMSI